jgi:outer membrane scaffolding protein for murein synthesis (MipA/OmpV family)
MQRYGQYNLLAGMAALLSLAAMPALAGDGAWQVSMGAGVSYAPRYEGAALNRLRLVPLLDVNYSNGGFFIGVARGIGFNFSESKVVQYGVRVLLGRERSQSEDPRLYGTGDINYYPEAGVFLSTRLGPLSLSSGAATSDYGTRADLGCGIGFPLGKDDRFRLNVTANWGDTNYNQTYFGVTATQAAASGNVLTPYNATEGVKDSVVSASWTHNYDKHWFANTSFSYKRLQGSAQLSPLTERPSMNSMSLMLGYHF